MGCRVGRVESSRPDGDAHDASDSVGPRVQSHARPDLQNFDFGGTAQSLVPPYKTSAPTAPSATPGRAGPGAAAYFFSRTSLPPLPRRPPSYSTMYSAAFSDSG